MPKLVKNYCLITLDDLVDSFEDTMNKLKDCGLKNKDDINFPLNVQYYKNEKNILFKKKSNTIPKEKIIIESEELKFYENLLFPEKLQPQPRPPQPRPQPQPQPRPQPRPRRVRRLGQKLVPSKPVNSVINTDHDTSKPRGRLLGVWKS